MNDKKLNDYIDHLLSESMHQRISSNGGWADSFDGAMAMWEERHPGTRPPAFTKVGPTPPCFTGKTPPVYEGELE